MDLLHGKRIAILGIARSGVALARVLSKMGARILLSDRKDRGELGAWLKELEGIPCEIETGGNTDALWQGSDMIIISPGVPIGHPLLEKARAAGVPVMAEVEMAYLLAKAPILAVTGTNGKSTTTKLISEILTADGRKSLFAGNIGIPLVEEVSKIPADGYIVSEISSFQLEGIHRFKPLVALCLNVTIDHQDRHASFEEYCGTKARLFMNQAPEDFAVLNRDDGPTMAMKDCIPSKILYFSRKVAVTPGVYFRDGLLWHSTGEGPDRALFPWKEEKLRGLHNLENVMAASAATLALGVSPASIVKAVEEFEPLHHRMELVRVLEGVSFIDDSKGTNPGAVIAALEGSSAPVVLIAGGSEKGTDFGPLGESIARHAKGLIVIGKTADKIAGAAHRAGFTAVHRAASLQEAVGMAGTIASAGDLVLLSPACASFDMFDNAEHRGDVFRQAVMAL